MIEITATGYFANWQRGSKVHYVNREGPICGAPFAEDMEFQWCAHGPQMDYVECEKCKAILRRQNGKKVRKNRSK